MASDFNLIIQGKLSRFRSKDMVGSQAINERLIKIIYSINRNQNKYKLLLRRLNRVANPKFSMPQSKLKNHNSVDTAVVGLII